MKKEMNITGLQQGVTTNAAKAIGIASFLDKLPHGQLNTILLRNLSNVAHAAAHVLYRTLTRMQQELADHPVDENMPLFNTPADHAMTVREVSDMIDGYKEELISSFEEDDTGKNAWELGTLANRILKVVANADDGASIETLEQVLSGEVPGAIRGTVYALVNLDRADIEDDVVTAGKEETILDIAKMIDANPGLNTLEWDASQDIESIPLPQQEDGEGEEVGGPADVVLQVIRQIVDEPYDSVPIVEIENRMKSEGIDIIGEGDDLEEFVKELCQRGVLAGRLDDDGWTYVLTYSHDELTKMTAAQVKGLAGRFLDGDDIPSKKADIIALLDDEFEILRPAEEDDA